MQLIGVSVEFSEKKNPIFSGLLFWKDFQGHLHSPLGAWTSGRYVGEIYTEHSFPGRLVPTTFLSS